ncbi:portal protein [Mycobacterium phage Sejanus]|nr:portal protein [Mycobacterium phage Sejanus]
MATVTPVAATDLRIVRRRRGALTASAGAPKRALLPLIAAAAPVNDPQQVFKGNTLGSRRENWQDEAWKFYRTIGELGYYVRWRKNSCSRVRLIASEIDPDTGRPTGGIDPDNAEGLRAAQIVRDMAGGPLGQAELIKRAVEVLTVPGELWIAILQRPRGQAKWPDGLDAPERWFVLTRKQIESGKKKGEVLLKLPDGSKHTFDKSNGDGMFRVWNQDAEDASEASSPVQACLDPLREIERTSRKIANADDSRLMNNGLLMIPSEASLPDNQAPKAAGQPTVPGAPAVPPGQRRVATSLQQMIVAVSKEGLKDAKSAASNAPVVVAAPGEHLKYVQHIEFGKESTKVDLEKRNDAIARLAMGLDMDPARLLGLGTNTNHWSSRQISDEDVQLHVAPVMQTLCQAIYQCALRNVLADARIDPDKYVLWYDASELTVDPDKTDEAKDAFEKGTITAEALVRQYGLPDDAMYDFETLEGWRQWAQDRVSQDPTLIRTLLPLLDPSLQALDFPEPPRALPAGEDDEDRENSRDVEEKRRAKDGEEPDTEDNAPRGEHAGGRSTELAVVDLLVGRALELAGKRRRTRSDMDRLRNIPTHLTHRFMGPVADAEVARLIKGWDDIFDDEFAAAHGVDPDRVRASVKRRVQRELTAALIDGQVV